MVLRKLRRLGRPMKCWDCGQELDTSSIEDRARRAAATIERLTIARAAKQSASILRRNGDPGAGALEAFGEELSAGPG